MASLRTRANEKIHYIASTTFTIDRCYTDLKLIGKGSYGVVCSALDMSKGKKVAIKKITPMAKTVADAKHVLREVRLMRYMGKHENIITLEDLMLREAADELYIVMELLDSDLHRIIQSPQVLTDGHVRHFMHQLLCGVKYMHDHRIIHRDLKPGNLLVTRDCKLRITDFGLARERPTGANNEDIDEPMTEHVVTRWYRPPELMLCPDGLYTYAVDIWSVGCIFVELLARRPLFPGKNFIHQLNLIFDVIGCPLASEVKHIVNNQARKFLESQVAKRKLPFELLFPELSGDGVLLLNAMLVFNPSKRLSADKLLELPYFDSIPDTSPSFNFPEVSDAFEFAFERSNSSKHQLKSLIAAEVASFKRSLKGNTVPTSTLDDASHHTASSKRSTDKPRSRSVDPRQARSRSTAEETRSKVFDDLYRNRSSSRSRNESREREAKSKQSSYHSDKRRFSESGKMRDAPTASTLKQRNSYGQLHEDGVDHRKVSAAQRRRSHDEDIADRHSHALYGSSTSHLHDSQYASTKTTTAPQVASDIDYDDVSIEEVQPHQSVAAKAVRTPERPIHQGIGYKSSTGVIHHHDIDPFEPDYPQSPSRRNKAALRYLDDDECSKRALDELTKQARHMSIKDNSRETTETATITPAVSTLRYKPTSTSHTEPSAPAASVHEAASTIYQRKSPAKPALHQTEYSSPVSNATMIPVMPLSPEGVSQAPPSEKSDSPAQLHAESKISYGKVVDAKHYDSDDASNVSSVDVPTRPETKHSAISSIHSHATHQRSQPLRAEAKPLQHTSTLAKEVARHPPAAKPEKKKKITVPMSPKFSTMSWQRREAPAVPPAKPRAASNSRGTRLAKNVSRDILDDYGSKRLYR